MTLNANKIKGGGRDIPPMEAGAYPARLVQIIDFGVQPQEYKGEKKDPKNEIGFTYEFADEFLTDEDGNEDKSKPRWLSEQFPLHNLSAEKARSTSRYTAMDPTNQFNGDFIKLVGAPVIVTIVQRKNQRTNIIRNYVAGVSGMRKKDVDNAPDLVNPSKVFTMDEPDLEIFKSVPQWIQDKIKDSLEFKGSQLDALLNGESNSTPAVVEDGEDW